MLTVVMDHSGEPTLLHVFGKGSTCEHFVILCSDQTLSLPMILKTKHTFGLFTKEFKASAIAIQKKDA